jgi:hypothetical protein
VKEKPRFHDVKVRNAEFVYVLAEGSEWKANYLPLLVGKSHSPPHAVRRGGTLPTAGSSHPEIILNILETCLRKNLSKIWATPKKKTSLVDDRKKIDNMNCLGQVLIRIPGSVWMKILDLRIRIFNLPIINCMLKHRVQINASLRYMMKEK